MEYINRQLNGSEFILSVLSAIQEDIHVVFVAATNGSFMNIAVDGTDIQGGYVLTRQRATQHCDQVNKANETGTLHPKRKISLLPLSIYERRNSWNDRASMELNIKDAFKANREYIKAEEMLFIFEQRVDFNSILAKEELDKIVEGQIDDNVLQRVSYTLYL